MTAELLIAVALLCQVSQTGNYTSVSIEQLKCQKALISCVALRDKATPAAALGKCVVAGK